MIFLIASIILTSWLTLAFKIVERFHVNTFQSIVFNYIFCVITGCVVNGYFPDYISFSKTLWFYWACLMGIGFVSLFNIIGFTAQKIGVTVASVANRLSLVIPFIFSLYLYDEKSSWLKIVGIVLALTAVVLTCLRQSDKRSRGVNKILLYVLPPVLFVGSGFLDTLIKYVQHNFISDLNKNDYLITAFSAAAFTGVIVLIIKLFGGRTRFSLKSVVAGFGIGVPNYFSIWCLMTVLKQFSTNSSVIIPINNMGIVLFSSVTAWLLFKEKLTWVNWTGIFLALGAIALIAFG